MRKTLLLATFLALGVVGNAAAVTKTFTWTWPTVRTDGTALPLAQIGGFNLYDASAPSPGLPGTLIPCPTTIPPTTAAGTCSGNVTAGHSFTSTTQDTAKPPDVSAGSNSVTVPFVAPPAITDLRVN